MTLTETNIKILEPITVDKKIFSKEDFIKYLSLHKDELEKFSTNRLNKMFSIPKYRITKIKGSITLMINNYKSVRERNTDGKNDDLKDDLRDDLKLLDEKIEYIISVLKENNLITDE
jgi:hypothetical protein